MLGVEMRVLHGLSPWWLEIKMYKNTTKANTTKRPTAVGQTKLFKIFLMANILL
jgi:hypothetical protein